VVSERELREFRKALRSNGATSPDAVIMSRITNGTAADLVAELREPAPAPDQSVQVPSYEPVEPGGPPVLCPGCGCRVPSMHGLISLHGARCDPGRICPGSSGQVHEDPFLSERVPSGTAG
jgi:hypothetical protein